MPVSRKKASLVKYQRNIPAKASGTTLLIGAILIALLIWLIMKNKPAIGQYRNTKTWEISYNADSMPTKIVKHVNAKVE